MRLYIMRHGPAAERGAQDSPPDAQRPLTPAGTRKTREVAEGLRELGIEPTTFFSSRLLRAVQTAEVVAAALQFPLKKIRRTDALLPEARPEALFQELAGLDEEEVICFGHGPHVDLAIAHALHLLSPITEMKKSGVVCIELESVSPPRGILRWYGPPKILRVRGK